MQPNQSKTCSFDMTEIYKYKGNTLKRNSHSRFQVSLFLLSYTILLITLQITLISPNNIGMFRKVLSLYNLQPKFEKNLHLRIYPSNYNLH